MKLRTVQIRNFRCIDDSGEFRLDDVTCLVGKNESGKTTILAALEKLNSAAAGRGDFSRLDYPRKKWRPNEPIPDSPPAVSTKWELTPEELAKFETVYGKGCFTSRELTFSKGYNNVLYIDLQCDEKVVAQTILSAAGVAEDAIAGLDLKGWTLAELLALKPSDTLPVPWHAAIDAQIKKIAPDGLASIWKAVTLLLPKFLYFGDYNKLAGQLSVDEFLKRKAAGTSTSEDRLFEALMSLAGTKPEDVSKLGKFEELNGALRAVSNQISSEIFSYWTQNRYLDFVLRFDQGRPEDPPPFNAGYIFRARIDNQRHKSDTNFDDRSSGFVWFFSFLVWFSQLKTQYGKRLVVLLDEPGLTLHARAQGDLLRYIKEKLRPQYQVVYTTHSPFMIDPDNLLSARTVEDVELPDKTLLGTKVGDKVLSTDADTLSPLQRVLDYEITQTLFVGRYVVLVEGPADLAYIKWASNELKHLGRDPLDYRWTICIVRGIDRIPPFASLFRGNGLQIVALTDIAHGQKQKIEKAREALGEKNVLTADTYAGQAEADIEDVLGREFYLHIVNATYGLIGPDKLSVADATGHPRIVKFVEEKFKLLPVRYGEFDHYRPAEWLINSGTDVATLPGSTGALERMHALIGDINSRRV